MKVPAALGCCLAVVLAAGIARALPPSQLEAYGGTVGAGLLDVAPGTIGVSYRLRVNEAADLASLKIVFIGVRTDTPQAPPGSGAGTIDLDVFSHWVEYPDDLGHAGWPEQGYPHPGEPSLWLRNIDYGGVGRVGVRPLTPTARALFPRQTAGIDRVTADHAALTSISAIHQGSILGRDVRVTLVRQPLARRSSELNWGHRFTWNGGVTPWLPAGLYWPWLATIEIEGEPTSQVLFLLDEERGEYVTPNGGISIRTEFFFRPDVPQNTEGVFQMFVWDVYTLGDGDPAWTPRSRWEYGEDVTIGETATGYGFRPATYAGQPVLEVSYPLGDYAQIGDVMEIGGPADEAR